MGNELRVIVYFSKVVSNRKIYKLCSNNKYMDEQKLVGYEVNDRVRINTGNWDGSIATLPDYRATIEEVVDKEHVKVVADDGDRFRVHVARLTKILDSNEPAD